VGAEIFTEGTAGALPGPQWLRDRRLRAFGALDELPEPTAELEEWRYSRIGELRIDRFTGLAPQPTTAALDHPVVRRVLDELGPLSGSVVVHDGWVEQLSLDDEVAGRGVRLARAADLTEEQGAALGAAMARPSDRFAALNDAFAADPVVLSVPGGVAVPHPVAVVSLVGAAGTVVAPRFSLAAGEDSDVSVLEVSLSDDELEALVLPVTELAVGRAARVRHTAVQDLGRRTWQIGSFVADVQADATLSAAVAALGGDYARLRLDCHLSGRGATGNLASVYFGDGDQTLDLRTFQEHVARDTTSNLMFKGAVAERSHSVYTGLIRIHPDARGSNAFQTNRNLKLSDDAWAESVPNLEIENNDVHCSHASTVGPVDPDQRFYLESRGVPTEVADRLVVAGFFDEVLDELPVPSIAAPVRARIGDLLDRLVGSGAGPGDGSVDPAGAGAVAP